MNRRFMKALPAGAAVLLALSLGSAAPVMAEETATEVSSPAGTGEISEETDTESAEETTEDGTVITVTGSGSVTAVPDIVKLVFSVETNGATVQEAQTQNSEKTNAVLDTLKSLGISDDDIKTSGFQLYPQYNYDENDSSEITGYNVTTEMTVSNQPVDNAGTILSGCFSAGVNNVSSIEYSCSNYDELYHESLQKAVADAKAKAETLAQAEGLTLGSVSSITEGYQDTTYAAKNRYSSSTYVSAASSDTSINVSPGVADIEADVTVAYRAQ